MKESAHVPRWLLIAGLLTGIAAAASGVLKPRGGDQLPADAVARINNRLIWRDAWLRAVASVASERRGTLSAEDQRHILDRLVDEELLVQHGLSLGLVEQDRRLRGQLVNEVLMNARAGTPAAATPAGDDARLRQFYDANRDFFAQPGRLQVKAYRFATDQREQADALARQLRSGVTPASTWIPPLPASLLPAAELRTYLGPSLTQTALALKAGEVSEPLPADGGFAVLKLEQLEATMTPPFESIRAMVSVEWQRRNDESAVRELLRELRESQHVVVRETLP
jgi:hypothetical protein